MGPAGPYRELGARRHFPLLALLAAMTACGAEPRGDRAAPPPPPCPSQAAATGPTSTWWPGLCAPVDQPLEEPWITEDRRLVAVCDPTGDPVVRRFRMID